MDPLELRVSAETSTLVLLDADNSVPELALFDEMLSGAAAPTTRVVAVHARNHTPSLLCQLTDRPWLRVVSSRTLLKYATAVTISAIACSQNLLLSPKVAFYIVTGSSFGGEVAALLRESRMICEWLDPERFIPCLHIALQGHFSGTPQPLSPKAQEIVAGIAALAESSLTAADLSRVTRNGALLGVSAAAPLNATILEWRCRRVPSLRKCLQNLSVFGDSCIYGERILLQAFWKARWTSSVKAFVERYGLDEGLNPETFKSWLSGKLPGHCRPAEAAVRRLLVSTLLRT
jgi:hypothetical protein